jgi:hypothetical protein
MALNSLTTSSTDFRLVERKLTSNAPLPDNLTSFKG